MYQAHASAFLKSKQTSVDGFATLMQRVTAEQYKGKRIRLSGLLKSQDVVGWAGLWMRVDQRKEAVAFDNMQDRSIKGTTGWRALRRDSGRTEGCDGCVLRHFASGHWRVFGGVARNSMSLATMFR